ncbi:methyltransferase domain-containing protein [Algihabitans albus]|uniref:methyltransferase domain-containing protein n=1 Tax=Algihabitans albus TaxID=2164067 RepID=UPI0013C2A453|nr:methyltransferase domain-containing protein [Algihabitans albus]
MSTRLDPSVSLPLRMRLKAWWHGYDLQVTRRLKELEENDHGVSLEVEEQPWDGPKFKVPQLIWGEGFLTPGGAERTAELVKPLALDKSMSVLDIGGHLGGQARLIAKDFGAWVTAVEPDPELAAVADLLSEREGLGKKADFHAVDPDSAAFRKNAFDVAISTDALYTIESKRPLLAAVGKALKKRSQLLLSDYIRDETVSDTAALEAWMKLEPRPVHLWNETEYRACLKKLRLDTRVFSDESIQLRGTIVAGFSRYLSEAAQSGVEENLQQALVYEVERWVRLVAALDSGAVKAVRIYALRN